MAEITRHVNPAADINGNGESEDLTGTPRAYHSLLYAESQEQADFETDTNNLVINCAGATADAGGRTVIDGSTTTEPFNITIKGEEGAGNYNTGLYRLPVTVPFNNGIVLNLNDPFTIVEDFQLELSNDSKTNCRGFKLSAEGCSTRRCISKAVLTGTSLGDMRGFSADAAESGDLHSCLAIDWDVADGVGFFGVSFTTSNFFINCTAENCVEGFITADNDSILINCWTNGATDGYVGTFNSSSDFNSSSVASDTTGGTNDTDNISLTYDNNVQPQNGDTDIGAGTGDDQSVALTLDLARNSWVTVGWGRGCMTEAAAAGGGRIMSSLARSGGLAGSGGIAGPGGGLAG